MPALIGYNNRVLSGTLTASSEAPTLPVANLASPHADPTNQWRTNVAFKAANFQIDTGSEDSTWRLFMIAATNFNSAGLVRWQVSNNADMSSPIYDSGQRSGTQPGYQQLVVITPAEITGRYARCTIANSSIPENWLSVGLAYAGPAYQPARGLSYESAWGVQPTQEIVETRGGQQYVTQRYRRRSWDFAFNSFPSAELFSSVAEVMRAADTGVNIAFVPFSDGDPNREAILGFLRTTSSIGYPQRIAQYRGWRGQITERL